MQAEEHRKEIEEFVAFREEMNKLREEEKKSRLFYKMKQLQECEVLQVDWPSLPPLIIQCFKVLLSGKPRQCKEKYLRPARGV
jgi:hypothetical protein